MKKHLTMFLTLMMMLALVSCGDTQESSSEPSDSVSEVTTEEPTTELETEAPTEKEIVLDTTWECDYLTIAKSSEWKEEEYIGNDKIVVRWEWQAWNNDRKIDTFIIGLYIYQPPKDETFGDYETDRFTKNEQEYIVLENKEIHFTNSVISGTICPSIVDEEIIMQMIDSIEFKSKENFEDVITTEITTEIVTTTTTIVTEPPTEKPTSPPVKPTETPTNPPVVVQKEEKTVYYTETGSKYHYDSKCGRGTYYPCTLDEALAKGLEPCQKCAS